MKNADLKKKCSRHRMNGTLTGIPGPEGPAVVPLRRCAPRDSGGDFLSGKEVGDFLAESTEEKRRKCVLILHIA
jgi:hypothetical protein